jgi:hypothetical protein
MTDDPLAHLYADLEDFDAEPLPTRTVSLDELVNADVGHETFDDHDVAELVTLCLDRLGAGTLTDEELVELGLGDLYDVNPDDEREGTDLHLNPLGIAVARGIMIRLGLIPAT